jgi:hypothetical protein
MRKHNVIVHDTAKRDGGLQRLKVDDVHVSLDFIDDKTLSFQLWQPTQEKLERLEILWLTLPTAKSTGLREELLEVLCPSQLPGKKGLDTLQNS